MWEHLRLVRRVDVVCQNLAQQQRAQSEPSEPSDRINLQNSFLRNNSNKHARAPSLNALCRRREDVSLGGHMAKPVTGDLRLPDVGAGTVEVADEVGVFALLAASLECWKVGIRRYLVASCLDDEWFIIRYVYRSGALPLSQSPTLSHSKEVGDNAPVPLELTLCSITMHSSSVPHTSDMVTRVSAAIGMLTADAASSKKALLLLPFSAK